MGSRLTVQKSLGLLQYCLFFFSPGYVALWDSQTPHRPASERGSCCLETSPPSRLPPQDRSLSLTLLSLCLLYFVLPPFEVNRLPFWVPGVFRQCSEIVLWKLLSIQMIFWWIYGGESGLPILFLDHLGTALWFSFFHTSFTKELGMIGPKQSLSQMPQGALLFPYWHLVKRSVFTSFSDGALMVLSRRGHTFCGWHFTLNFIFPVNTVIALFVMVLY